MLSYESSGNLDQIHSGSRPHSRDSPHLQLPMLTLSPWDDRGSTIGQSSAQLRRPTLPPLSQLHDQTSSHAASAFSHGTFPPHDSPHGYEDVGRRPSHTSQPFPGSLPSLGPRSTSLPIRGEGSPYPRITPTGDASWPHDPRGLPYNPKKRSLETTAISIDK